jgi:hypothetical protein
MMIGMIAGPAIGGVLVATAGLPATYAVDTATFVVSLGALRMMRGVPPPEAEPPSLERIFEGLRYARSRPELMGVESGAVATFAGVRTSIVSGGVLCVAGVAVAILALPAFWRDDARGE